MRNWCSSIILLMKTFNINYNTIILFIKNNTIILSVYIFKKGYIYIYIYIVDLMPITFSTETFWRVLPEIISSTPHILTNWLFTLSTKRDIIRLVGRCLFLIIVQDMELTWSRRNVHNTLGANWKGHKEIVSLACY